MRNKLPGDEGILLCRGTWEPASPTDPADSPCRGTRYKLQARSSQTAVACDKVSVQEECCGHFVSPWVARIDPTSAPFAWQNVNGLKGLYPVFQPCRSRHT